MCICIHIWMRACSLMKLSRIYIYIHTDTYICMYGVSGYYIVHFRHLTVSLVYMTVDQVLFVRCPNFCCHISILPIRLCHYLCGPLLTLLFWSKFATRKRFQCIEGLPKSLQFYRDVMYGTALSVDCFDSNGRRFRPNSFGKLNISSGYRVMAMFWFPQKSLSFLLWYF